MRPAGRLAVEHAQLVVDALGALMGLYRGGLLLLLGGQVAQHPVDRRDLKSGELIEELVSVCARRSTGSEGDFWFWWRVSGVSSFGVR